ncbi:MAG: hypothetical protein ACLTKE_09740 [Coprococcus sp.]
MRVENANGSGVISNNIFYNASTANPNDEWEPNGNKKFSNNLYYGYTPTPSTDKHAVVVAESEKDQILSDHRLHRQHRWNDS